MARRSSASPTSGHAGQIAHEAARKGVARAGRIVDLFERKRRDAERAILVDQHGAVLAALDHQRLRTKLENVARGAQQVMLIRKLACFRVVDHQDVRVPQRLAKFLRRALDPVVHGVERDDLRAALHLMQDRGLQRRIDIRQENMLRRLIRLGQPRLEFGEHVQFRRQRGSLIHVFAVLPRPEERLSVRALQAQGIDAAASKNGRVLLGEIVAHDSHQIDVREKTRGDGKVRRRAAEHAVHLPVRRFHGVKRNRTYDE